MSYTTPAQAAKTIRAALKAQLGANARHISVRAQSYSMGSSIRVDIKSMRFSKADVERIAREQEHVRRCEATGEILNGGNQYVWVDYTRECIAPLVAHVEARLRSVESDPGLCVTIAGVAHFVSDRGYVYSIDADPRSVPSGIPSAAKQIALAILSGDLDAAACAVELDMAAEAGHDVTDAMIRVTEAA